MNKLITFREYNPVDPGSPGPLKQGEILGQGTTYRVVNTYTNVPSYIVAHPDGNITYPAHVVVTETVVTVSVFYCYSDDGQIIKVLPEHIVVLVGKTI